MITVRADGIKGGNYEEKVAAFMEKHPELKAEGSINMLNISHDDWCGIFKGRACDCDPEISTKFAVTASGE
jgi:hypothetical protein